MQKSIQRLQEKFNDAANPIKAEHMSAYMKNKFVFFGIQKPERVVLFREWKKDAINETKHWNSELIKILWQLPEREYQYCAMELMNDWKRDMKKMHLSEITFCIEEKSWWDTVDYLASTVAGNFFQRYPEEIYEVINRWNLSPNLWLNRSAIIFQLKYKQKTDLALLGVLIDTHKNSKEFFHQKAIGWALRTVARFNPEFVREKVAEGGLAPLSKREALKHIK